MQSFVKSLLISTLALPWVLSVSAQETSDQPQEAEPAQTQPADGATQRENPATRVPYESGQIGMFNGTRVEPGLVVFFDTYAVLTP